MRPARLLLAALLVPAWCPAQPPDVSAPFVSRLRAQVRATAIVLTWSDSTDVRGPVAVFRSAEEITAETFARAQKVAEVPYGAGSYADHPSDTRPHFYAVLASDAGGRWYEVFVAFRNKTVSAIAVQEVGSPEEVGARIDGIRAEVSAGAVRVSFGVDRPGRVLVLYRSTAPITSVADLSASVAVILEPGTTTCQDAPPAGIAFYYAVADEEQAKTGKARFEAGVSSTAAPVSLPLAAASGRARAAGAAPRTPPLPFVALSRGVYSGDDVGPGQTLPVRRDLGPEAEEAVAALLAGLPSPAPEPMRPVALEIDKAVSGGGEESILQSIVRDVLASGDKRAAEEKLRNFVSVRRSAELEARARFYLGQVLYFEQRTREALLELLPALDVYYAEVWPWVDRCLNELAGTLPRSASR